MLAGILLAGGRSSRMGQNKALLQYQNQPLHQHMVGLLTQAGAGKVVVSGLPEHQGYVPDRVEAQGPIGGIDACIQQLDTAEYVLVLPVDMPLLPVACLTQLVDQLKANASGVCFEKYWLPCGLRNDADLKQLLTKLMASQDGRDRSMRALLKGRELTQLDLTADHRRFINANTPGEWQTCLEFDQGKEA
ncbi:molybdenum cofactor guanylyltransferase [Pelagibaculum spongiae]|uniref:Molybdenum cofactor guanylyltransferase n=1 Tax=Pelagibaculum spongiae TaxID=2080658 RepID=A0A2V1H2Y7_9GAMM|nr:molybdenum cofactor guanylyltransferase [Pelagibaculum spongiae]PVZ71588.1 molybdenum cofactor guanylyltransferase [Pelagibaculum spongiae]